MGAAEQLQTTQMTFAISTPRVLNERTEWLVRYSKFNDIYDFNNEYEMIMVEYKRKFTVLQHHVLNVVRKLAAKVPGVCNASHKYIQEQFKARYGRTVSTDTISRTIEKAESYGILIKCNGWRRNKSYTANVLIFNRYDEVKAYAIAALQKSDEETAAMLEMEYAAMEGVMQYAFNKKMWATEKKRKEMEREAAAKRQADEAKKAAQAAKARKQTMNQKLKALVAANQLTKAEAAEMNKVVYGERNKLMKADERLTQDQAEQIVWEAFMHVLTNRDSIKKNIFAATIDRIRRKVNEFVNGYTEQEVSIKKAQGARKRFEIEPEWFANRNDKPTKTERTEAEILDFEAAKQAALERLREIKE